MTNTSVKKWFYERNDLLLADEIANPYFETVLGMSREAFREWCIYLRKRVTYIWDELGTPPVVGRTEEDMIEIMNKIISYPDHKLLVKDELTGEKDTIYNTESQTSGVLNGFFPTMMKTRINYSKDASKGVSIYDFFAQDKLLDRFITYATRHFKRDSFYHHSRPVKEWDTSVPELCSKSGIEWIEKFELFKRKAGTHDYWLQPEKDEDEYTGYNEKLKGVKYLSVSKSEIEKFEKVWLNLCVPNRCKVNMKDDVDTYRIRYFELDERLFPMGFQAFRISYCQSPAQFPPLTAKYLYKRYTNHIKDQDKIVLYDPSAGWSGRLLGAMSVNDRNIHYIGTDPNPDHSAENGRTKYHEVADFILNKSVRASEIFGADSSYEIFQDGSEVIKHNPKFQKRKGKIDLIFTSPPYFSKELYSEDPNQSAKKFTTESEWKEGFLRPTLETCAEYLRHDRYLLWNIAPVKYGKEWLPLDEWSKEILLSLGLEYKGIIKMSLAPMPGGNRLTEDEEGNIIGTTLNMVKVNGLYRKFEPILVFYKGCNVQN